MVSLQRRVVNGLKSGSNPTRIEQVGLGKLGCADGVMSYATQFALVAGENSAFRGRQGARDFRRRAGRLGRADLVHPRVQENVHEQQEQQACAQLQFDSPITTIVEHYSYLLGAGK